MTEACWHRRLEFHGLMRHWMIEAQQPCMQAQTMKRVVAIAILRITTHGMAHISRMYTNLILSTRLQLELDECVLGRAV